ncbi:hypothetical protein CBS101457_002188 [Exobasidium rhododendri]|nr:hypothetical protein CBS101457_002188 [Exobasidium rhododendri]
MAIGGSHQCWAGARALSRRCHSSVAAPSQSPSSQTIRALLAHHQSQSKDPSPNEETIQILGFARSIRSHRKLTFIDLTDGSLSGNSTLQAVIKGHAKTDWDNHLSSGVGLELTGRFQESKGADQAVEFAVEELKVTGKSEASKYPLAGPSNLTPSAANILHRKYAHLRPREARHASVLRTRSAMEKGLTDYFWDNEFTRVVAPIITSSDCEGGGEVFSVEAADERGLTDASELDLNMSQEPSLSGSTSDQPSTRSSSDNMMEEQGTSQAAADRHSFWSDSTAYLTVSSQLHLEALALGLGRVYTVGPSFRAESSATNRHLAEFWMCEAEMLTSSDGEVALEQVMSVVEGLIKRITSVSMSRGEVGFLWEQDGAGLERLKQIASKDVLWPRLTYSEAVDALQKARDSFTVAVPEWGASLASEHERWLARDGPIFITHYPASIKPFYMREDEDPRTVACFDLLVPRIGELVGGSLREERREVLNSRMADLPPGPNLAWYVDDLRKYGCNPHGGFGLGMERMLSFITNTENLRDCLTFPRVKGQLRF